MTFGATVRLDAVVEEEKRTVCTTAVPFAPATGALSVETEIDVVYTSPALAGATEDTTPRPKAATATSAMRLKVVFVDICFLSISRVREFPDLGLELIS